LLRISTGVRMRAAQRAAVGAAQCLRTHIRGDGEDLVRRRAIPLVGHESAFGGRRSEDECGTAIACAPLRGWPSVVCTNGQTAAHSYGWRGGEGVGRAPLRSVTWDQTSAAFADVGFALAEFVSIRIGSPRVPRAGP